MLKSHRWYCGQLLVDGEAVTMRNLEADYPKETVPMAESLSQIKLRTMKLSSYTFHDDKDSNQKHTIFFLAHEQPLYRALLPLHLQQGIL